MKREVNYSNWREDLREVVDVPPIEPKKKTRKSREVTGEGVNNKVVVNPTMAEANEVFKELGGTVLGIQERTLTPEEEAEKEDIVKGMKKKKGDFEKRYGEDAKSVMYATATKMAKEDISDAMKAVKASLPKGALMKGGTRKPVSPEEKRRRYTNYLKNTKKDDPYRSRPGESD